MNLYPLHLILKVVFLFQSFLVLTVSINLTFYFSIYSFLHLLINSSFLLNLLNNLFRGFLRLHCFTCICLGYRSTSTSSILVQGWSWTQGWRYPSSNVWSWWHMLPGYIYLCGHQLHGKCYKLRSTSRKYILLIKIN